MQTTAPYLILAYYHFYSISDPHKEVKVHKAFLQEKDVKARIYISEGGINGQMSASYEDAHAYIEWIHSRPEYAGIEFKLHQYHEHVFPRLCIKYRKQLVAIDTTPDLSQRGQYLSPQEWRSKLESNKDYVLVDVRNDYEWQVGHFEGAELPACETFRDFNRYANELKTRMKDKNVPVLMYCTGGIRCELYSAILKEQGIDEVYQLHGGIINYGLEEGNAHWKGKLFVFDDRLVTPISEEPTEVIGQCNCCHAPTEDYYNCANMECNRLFLCCKSCLDQLQGCCQKTCQEAPKVRPYHEQDPHKPFRKWYHYFPELKDQKKEAQNIDGDGG